MRFQRTDIEALQEAIGEYLVGILENSNLCAIYAKRVSFMLKDVCLGRQIRRERDNKVQIKYGITF